MLVGIANGVKEMWIAQQPFLLFYYAWQYAPTFAWFITNMLGRKRVQNFKAGLVSTCTKSMQYCIVCDLLDVLFIGLFDKEQ